MIAIEILQFVFQDLWHWLGAVIIIFLTGIALAIPFAAGRSRS